MMKIRFFIRFAFLLAMFCCFAATIAAQRPRKILKPIPDGYSLIDGDIVMPTDEIQAILKNHKLPSSPNAAVHDTLWTNGIIPFQFQSTNALPSNCPNAVPTGSVSNANQTTMLTAMAILESTANIDFQQCAGANCPAGNSVLIRDSTNDITRDSANNCVNGSANNSPVGMVGGQQIINIVSWTGERSQGIIMHELLHTLGFYHEQSRADRNTYVTINCMNVRGGCNGTLFNSNFVIENDATAFGYYDFDSIMHYGQCTFTAGSNCPTDGTQTVTVNAPFAAQWQSNIGQRTRLSDLDSATLSYLYPPNNWVFFDCTRNTLPQSGQFFQPYSVPSTAINNTPVGGTLVVLKNCTFPVGTYNRQIKFVVAPGVTARFGN